MSDALFVSQLLLWVLVVALAVVVAALARQIGVLHERVSPAGALLGREGPRPGEPAPVVEVEDGEGARLRIGAPDPGGASTLLLFVAPACPICKVVLPIARSLRSAEGGRLRLVIASDGPRGEHEAFLREQRLERETVVLSAPLGLAWQVPRVPYAALIDAQGVVRARGLVNTREHLESLLEARERGVASIQEYMASGARSEPEASGGGGAGYARAVPARPEP
jgi:methylamine dehydrogenase accessory protein MauD